jgi:hypothetical protein
VDLELFNADFAVSPYQLSNAYADALTKNGCISMDLVHFVKATLQHNHSSASASRTSIDHPEPLYNDKVPMFYPNACYFTIPELHQYICFQQLNGWSSI